MADFITPPTAEEMQYASDAIHGKRKRDLLIVLISAVIGAFFGLLIGFAGNEANDEPIDPIFILGCIGVVAFCFAVITLMILFALRSIVAVCRAWVPARILAIVAVVYLVVNFLGKVRFWFIFPSQIVMDVVMEALLLIFAILLLNYGLRLLFLLYCMVTGKDEERIMVEQISPTP